MLPPTNKRRDFFNDSDGFQYSYEKLNQIVYEDLTEMDMISLNYGLHAIALLSFFYPTTGIFINFMVYFLEGRFSGYYPTVSETGIEYPNNVLFAFSNAIGSFVTSFTMLLIICYLQQHVHISRFISEILYALLTITGLGIAFTGMSPLDEIPYFHYAASSIGFLSTHLFEIATFIISKDCTSMCLKIYRLNIILAQLIGLLVFLVSDTLFDDRVNVTVSTIGEYITFITIQFYLLTWKKEISSMKFFLALV